MPKSVTLKPGQNQKFTIKALDQRGNNIAIEKASWSTTGGRIDQSGNFVANQTTIGDIKITANAPKANLRAVANVTVISVLKRLTISPNKISLDPEERFTFDIAGFDQANKAVSSLKVSWECTQGGKINKDGTFIGGYKKRTVIVIAKVDEITESATVTLNSVLRQLVIYPQDNLLLKPGEQKQFTVVGLDQYQTNIDITNQNICWEATGGTIDDNGNFIANLDSKGTFTVKASIKSFPDSDIKHKIFIIGLHLILISKILSALEIIQDSRTIKIFMYFMSANQLDLSGESNYISLISEITTNIIDVNSWFQGIFTDSVIRLLENVGRFCIDVSQIKLSTCIKVTVPPVLTTLKISPPVIKLKTTESWTFIAKGFDQQGDLIIPDSIIWNAEGGEINSKGEFVAGNFASKALISAASGSIHASIEIFISQKSKLSLADESRLDLLPKSLKRLLLNEEYKLDNEQFELENEEIISLIEYRSQINNLAFIEYLLRNRQFNFYRTQLFYDGYSFEEFACEFDYSDYLEYMDYKSYFEDKYPR
ncbi:MAG: hypothetical protein LRZ84_23715 [Desertifilum sp.]|nr:hypothetical protein [Desertifilum sp.]